MPQFDKNTPKDVLRKQAEEDIARISKTVQRDSSGREYFWNKEIGFFESEPDENGKCWVKGIDSSVPGYWFYCPEVTGTNTKGYEIVCNSPHFVFSYQDGEKLTCRECKAESTIKLVIKE